MKYRSFVQAGIAVLTLASSHAFAQLTKAYEHGVTLTLTEYSEGAEKETTSTNSTRTVTTTTSTFVTRKFSNKEFLQGLVQQNVISSINGWSLKHIASTDGDDDGLFITKANTPPIDVSSYIGIYTYDVVEEFNETETDFANGNFTEVATWNERGYSEVMVNIPGFNVMLDGSYYSKHSSRFEYLFIPDTETYDEKLISANIYSLVGVNPVSGSPQSFVEGSAAVGAGRLINFIFVNNPE